jgi:hypothetical protein
MKKLPLLSLIGTKHIKGVGSRTGIWIRSKFSVKKKIRIRPDPDLQHCSQPCCVIQVKQLCPETVSQLQSQQVLKLTVLLLSQTQQLKIHFNALEGSYALCLTANLIHLLHLETVDSLGEVGCKQSFFIKTSRSQNSLKRALEGSYALCQTTYLLHLETVDSLGEVR